MGFSRLGRIGTGPGSKSEGVIVEVSIPARTIPWPRASYAAPTILRSYGPACCCPRRPIFRSMRPTPGWWCEAGADIEAAHRAGFVGVLQILTGHGMAQRSSIAALAKPEFYVRFSLSVSDAVMLPHLANYPS